MSWFREAKQVYQDTRLGGKLAEDLIENDLGYLSDESIAQIAAENGATDSTFAAEIARTHLDEHYEEQQQQAKYDQIRESGSPFAKAWLWLQGEG